MARNWPRMYGPLLALHEWPAIGPHKWPAIGLLRLYRCPLASHGPLWAFHGFIDVRWHLMAIPPPSPHAGALATPPPLGLGLPTNPAILPPLPILEPPGTAVPIIPAAAPVVPSHLGLGTTPSPLAADVHTIAAPTTLDSVPVPAKLRARILELEFIEMYELLPEAWDIGPTHSCCPGSRRQSRRAPVQDILLWTECFSSLVAILGSAHPHHIADFMAYQRSIVRASRIFEGNAWVVYDRCYRRRAALSRDLNWSIQCTGLYNEAFTGRARTIPRCGHCLSENHSQADCPDMPQGQPAAQRQASVPLIDSQAAPVQRPRTFAPPSPASASYCRLFNQVLCRSKRCRFQHLCNICSLPHPAQVCPSRSRRDRSPPTHRPPAAAHRPSMQPPPPRA